MCFGVPAESLSLFRISENQLKENADLCEVIIFLNEYKDKLPKSFDVHLNILNLVQSVEGYNSKIEFNIISRKHRGIIKLFSLYHDLDVRLTMEVEMASEFQIYSSKDELKEFLDELFASGIPKRVCDSIYSFAPQ